MKHRPSISDGIKADQRQPLGVHAPRALRALLLVTVAGCASTLANAQILYQNSTPQFNANVPLTSYVTNPRTGSVQPNLVNQAPAVQFAAPGSTAAVMPVSFAGNGPAAVSLGSATTTFPVTTVQTQPQPQPQQQNSFVQMISSAMPVVFPIFGGGNLQAVAPNVRPSTTPSSTANAAAPAAVALGPASGGGGSEFVPLPAPSGSTSPNQTSLNNGAFIDQSGDPGVVSFTSTLSDTSAVTFPAPGETQVAAASASQADALGNTTYTQLEMRYGTGAAQPAAKLLSGPLTRTEVASLDLAGLIRRTIDSDSRVTGLEFRLDASDTQADSLRGAWRPRLETGYETDYNLLQGTTNSAILAVRQRIFDFGRTDAALKTNAARRVLSGARIDDMRFNVATEFMSAYLSYLTAERGIQADNREISALRASLEANQRLADSGATSIIAARQSQIDLNQALSRQSERRLSQSQAEQQLSSLAGVPIRPSSGSFDEMASRFVPGSIDQCIGQAIGGDPGLAVIEAQLIEAATHINEIAIQNLPSIDLIGQTGFSPFSASSDLGIRRNTGFNIAINGNLFDGGVNKAEVQAQELRIRELQRERSTVERELELDIRRAYTSARTLTELLSTQQSSLSVLRSLIQDRQRQADAGVGLRQDVLRAQVEFEQAQNALTDIQADLDRERARLVLLCGNRF